jgi:glucose-6-phosphate isomerase
MMAPFEVSLNLGDGAPGRALHEAMRVTSQSLPQALKAVAQLRTDGLPHFKLPFATADLAGIDDVAAAWARQCTDVVVMGIGGSSLGAQALVQIAGPQLAGLRAGGPRLHFAENLDGQSLEALFAQLSWRTTKIYAVSKSGGTIETLAQLCAAISRIEAELGAGTAGSRIAIVTEPRQSPMRMLAEKLGCLTMNHDPDLGGRFSALSLVGLVPAGIAGLNPAAIRQGAASMLEQMTAQDALHAAGAVLNVAAAASGLKTHVMWAYADKLDRLVMWWRQLWGESLGKGGHGTTPVHALGPVDQHSQLQLYLDGPNDKLFTVMTVGAGSAMTVPQDWADVCGMNQLGGKTFGEIVNAQARATAQTLAANGRPVRTIHIPVLDERAIGALMMHFMLETLVAAQLLGVDPFDQPAVEQGKQLTRAFLAGTNA